MNPSPMLNQPFEPWTGDSFRVSPMASCSSSLDGGTHAALCVCVCVCVRACVRVCVCVCVCVLGIKFGVIKLQVSVRIEKKLG